nr:hypothetical protein [uncultured bacterium]
MRRLKTILRNVALQQLGAEMFERYRQIAMGPYEQTGFASSRRTDLTRSLWPLGFPSIPFCQSICPIRNAPK